MTNKIQTCYNIITTSNLAILEALCPNKEKDELSQRIGLRYFYVVPVLQTQVKNQKDLTGWFWKISVMDGQTKQMNGFNFAGSSCKAVLQKQQKIKNKDKNSFISGHVQSYIIYKANFLFHGIHIVFMEICAFTITYQTYSRSLGSHYYQGYFCVIY